LLQVSRVSFVPKRGFFLGFEGEQAKRRTRNETKNGLIGERTKRNKHNTEMGAKQKGTCAERSLGVHSFWVLIGENNKPGPLLGFFGLFPLFFC